jgi:hypothetical protein
MFRFAMDVNCSFLTGLWQKYGGRVRKFVRFFVLLACTIVVIVQVGCDRLHISILIANIYYAFVAKITWSCLALCVISKSAERISIKFDIVICSEI